MTDLFFNEYYEKDIDQFADKIDELFVHWDSKMKFLKLVEGELQARALEEGQSSPQQPS